MGAYYPGLPTLPPTDPLAINNTMSDPYANSYCSQNYADDYFGMHFNASKASQWAALTDDQKTLLLINACRVLETIRCTVLVPLQRNYNLLYDYHSHMVLDVNLTQLPVKYYYYQALQFPRNLDRDPVSGALFIPQPVLMAECEQAVYLLSYDDTNQATRMQGVIDQMQRVGSLHVRQTFAVDGSSVAPMALELMRPFSMKTSTSMRRA